MFPSDILVSLLDERIEVDLGTRFGDKERPSPSINNSAKGFSFPLTVGSSLFKEGINEGKSSSFCLYSDVAFEVVDAIFLYEKELSLAALVGVVGMANLGGSSCPIMDGCKSGDGCNLEEGDDVLILRCVMLSCFFDKF
tara:strand:+ start:1095 stop:1511 length:417 start_codon:yes stop_codon:yes gene_type:complete